MEQICALQKQYGKTPAELEILVEGFSWALSDYGIDKIIDAMRLYIYDNSDIPAPADIIKIIKQQEVFDKIKTPDINDLIRYKEKGITLTTDQKAQLDSYENN